MEQSSNVKGKSMYYINSLLVFVIMFAIPLLPPFGQITEMGMKVLGVFLGMLYGWLTVGFVWPSLLGLVMLGFSGANTISGGLSAGLGNVNLVVYSLLGFMFATYLDSCELTSAIAAYFLTRKVIDKRPYILVGMFFVVAYVLGAFVNIFAGIFLSWAILYKVIDFCGYEKHSMKVAYLLALVPFAAVLGMMFPPFHASAIMYSGLAAEAMGGPVGISISYAGWMLFQLVTAVVMMVLYVAVGKFVFRFDYSMMAATSNFEYLKSGKLTYEQKFGLADLILVILILTAPEFLPKSSAIFAILKELGVGGAFLIGLIIPIIVKGADGKPLCDIKGCMAGVAWDVIWMLVATGPVSAAMQSADCGIMATIVQGVLGMVGNMNWIVFTIVCAVVLGLITQVTHNVIIAIVLFGPLSLVCQQMGGNPIIWFFINYVMNMAAFMTPAASVNSALLFGNTDWVSPKHCYLLGTVWFVINLVTVCLTGFTLGQVLF